jgi:hypothetical protein
VGGQHLQGLGRRAVLCAAIVAEQHEGQRTFAKEVAPDFEFGQASPSCRTTAPRSRPPASLPGASPS